MSFWLRPSSFHGAFPFWSPALFSVVLNDMPPTRFFGVNCLCVEWCVLIIDDDDDDYYCWLSNKLPLGVKKDGPFLLMCIYARVENVDC